jgi:carbonic anhydrase
MTIPPHLAKGYESFRRRRLAREVQRDQALAAGEEPETMVIACADSRVDPAAIFQAAPGELFVVRNVAALVPPCEANGSYHGTSAAIEFAVTVLGVKSIVVLGHGQCGGVAASLRAAADGPPAGVFIGPWVALLSSSRDELLEHRPELSAQQRQRELELLAVKQSLFNLTTFPFVATAIETGKLELHGAWFSTGPRELLWLDHDRGTFDRVATGGVCATDSGRIQMRSPTVKTRSSAPRVVSSRKPAHLSIPYPNRADG